MLQNFHLKDDTTIDDSIIKRDFVEMYHQLGVWENDENQTFKFCFAGKLSFKQIGNAYVEWEIEVEKIAGTNFTLADNIR